MNHFLLICCSLLLTNNMSAKIIHLGKNLKELFPFASDPDKRLSDAPYISGNTLRSIAIGI